MLVVPIRAPEAVGVEKIKEGRSVIASVMPIGVVQCINKLGLGDDGEPPVFDADDEANLVDLCKQASGRSPSPRPRSYHDC